eukprot:9490731-Pyramimonas_sp.AAC.3
MGATVAPLPPEVVVEDAGKAASGSDGLPKPVHVDARMSIEEMVPKLTGLPSLTRPEVPVATLFSGEILGVTTKLVQSADGVWPDRAGRAAEEIPGGGPSG